MLLRASLQGCCPWRRLAPVEGRGKHNTAEVAQKQAQEGDGGTDAAMPISSPHVSRLRGVFACQEDRTARRKAQPRECSAFSSFLQKASLRVTEKHDVRGGVWWLKL